MKRWKWIGLLFLVVGLIACHRNAVPNAVETRHGTSPLHPSELAAIDSLLWTQPDSALARLVPYWDEATEYDPHYANLLLAELLYKNDYEQTNRAELKEAVMYYDSVGHGFLSARAHYINGVGYYEQDSVVPACEEYLKALEIMEEHFEDEDLVGKKAKFMALTYIRLGWLFSDHFMIESSIECYEKALVYCKREPTSPNGVSNILYRIGVLYDEKNEPDKAELYYVQALDDLNSSDNLLFRDIVTSKAIADYQLGVEPKQVLDELQQVLSQVDSQKELLRRYMIIGAIYFEEGLYDSTLRYYVPVFQNETAIAYKIPVAESLRVIYDTLGDKMKSEECVRFLASYTKSEGEGKALVSQLDTMFKNYWNKKQESNYLQETTQRRRWIMLLTSGLLITILIVVLMYCKKRKREQSLETQMEKERQVHEIEKKAMGGRLKRSNEELKQLKKQLKQIEQTKKPKKGKANVSFAEEPICLHIHSVCNDVKNTIKSTLPISEYDDIALTQEQIVLLREAATKHYGSTFQWMKRTYPHLKDKDFLYCYLSLLELDNVQIAALLQISYSAVWEREKRLKKILNNENNISVILNTFINNT